MFKEKLLKHQIEQVEKAGYHVIRKDRVEHIGAQYSYDKLTEDAYSGDIKQLREYHEREMLLSMAYELGKVVRWAETKDDVHMRRIVRAILTVIKPKENENESTRCVPRFAESPGVGTLAGGSSQGQGFNEASPPSAGQSTR